MSSIFEYSPISDIFHNTSQNLSELCLALDNRQAQ